jgi:hypothetical protein
LIQDPNDPFNIDHDGLWQNAREIESAGITSMSLDPHDLLLYLCINAAFHDLYQNGLRGLFDIAAAIDHFQEGINWEEIYCRSKVWKADKLVFVTLYLVRELLGATIPVSLLTRLATPNFDPKVFTICMDFIFGNSTVNDPGVTPDLNRFIKAGNLFEKAKILLNRLFISRWEMAGYYHLPPDSWRLLCYYPVRLGYLMRQYLSTIIAIKRGSEHLIGLSKQIESHDNLRKALLENLVST